MKPNTLYKRSYNAALDLIKKSGRGHGLPAEAALCAVLGVSRTTVRAILTTLAEKGLVAWSGREKRVLRRPVATDYYPDSETASPAAVTEARFLEWVLRGDCQPGQHINELELARAFGVSTSSVREFLFRFSRFGLIEKQRSAGWAFKGFTRAFALELSDVRELFEVRSALRFSRLPEDHPFWTKLALLKEEHHQILDAVEERYREFSALDGRFHRLINVASENRFVIDFNELISLIFHYHYQWSKVDEMNRNRIALGEHLVYIDALRSRSEERIRAACNEHLATARRTLLLSLRDYTAQNGHHSSNGSISVSISR